MTMFRLGKRPAFLVVLVACLGLWLASQPIPVLAHAAYVGSDPAADSVVPTSPTQVTAWFSEPMAPTASSIEVLDSLGRRVDANDSKVHPDDLFRMSVSIPALANGTYTVAWRNVSVTDGHGISGSFLFFVGVRPPDAASSAAPEAPLLQSNADPVVRWVMLLGALAVLGTLLFEPAILRPAVARANRRGVDDAAGRARERIARLTWGGLALFLVGSLGQLWIQAAITANTATYKVTPGDISDVFATDWGFRWLVRLACILGVAVLLAAEVRARRDRTPLAARLERFGWLPAAALSLGALITVTLSSHDAAVTDFKVEGILTDAMHLTAAGFWVGGLFALLATVLIARGLSDADRRGFIDTLASRFSIFAGTSVGILVVTGLYSSFLQVTSRRAFDTPYGTVLAVKLMLVLGILAFAAANLLWVRPRLRDGRGGAWLRRFVTGEVVLAVLIVLSVGVLTSLEPARQVKSRDDQRNALSFGETVDGTRISGHVGPGTVGTNRVTIELSDRSGAVTDATNVLVTLKYLDKDLSPIQATALHTTGGTYEPPAQVLSVAGKWEISVEVSRPGAFDARTASRFDINSPSGFASTFASQAVPVELGRTYWSYVVIAVGALVLIVLPGAWRSRPARARLRILGTATVLVGVVLFYGAHNHSSGALADIPVTNPYPPDNASVEIGRDLYAQHCVTCHGTTGAGDGPGAAGLVPPPADLTTHIPLHTDGAIFYFITNGFPGTAMPAWANTLTEEQRWHLVNYLRTLATPLPTK